MENKYQSKINDIINMVDNELKDNVYAIYEVYQHSTLPVIAVDISWGDWKHDHLRCDYIIKEKFNNLGFLSEMVTENDGSDCYSSIHYYYVSMDR